jgi:hypothetical protein
MSTDIRCKTAYALALAATSVLLAGPPTLSIGIHDDQVALQLQGEPGSRHDILLSTNLKDWSVVATNTAPSTQPIFVTNLIGTPSASESYFMARQLGIPNLSAQLVACDLGGGGTIQLDGDFVYFAESVDGNGMIRRVPKVGGLPETLVTGLSNSSGQLPVFEIIGETIYGAYGGYQHLEIFSAPTTGGSALPITTVIGGAAWIGVFTGPQIYYLNGFYGINRIRFGIDAEIAINNWVRSCRVDGNGIYFVEYQSKELRKCSFPSNRISTLIGSDGTEGTIFDDIDHVYLNRKGTITRVAKDGGDPVPLVTTGNALGFASSGSKVFYVESGDIRSIPVDGGTPEVIVTGIVNEIVALAVHGEHVYWRDSGNVNGHRCIRRTLIRR